jgi:hypothetical protein
MVVFQGMEEDPVLSRNRTPIIHPPGRRRLLRSILALGDPQFWSWLLSSPSDDAISSEPATSQTRTETSGRGHPGSAVFLRIIRGHEAGSRPAGASKRGPGLAGLSPKVLGLALALVVSSACAADLGRYTFDRYNIGTAELWISGQVQVHQECARRGAVGYSNGANIYGCADFQDRVIISVPDPKIIAHELCHWTTQSNSHEVCPAPVIAPRYQ